MKMNSKVQDLIAKICQFTRVSARKVLLWRSYSRGRVQMRNNFMFVKEPRKNGESADLFRPKKEVEIFYVRLKTQEEEEKDEIRAIANEDEEGEFDRDEDPPMNLNQPGCEERPIFCRITADETSQLIDNYS